MGTPALIGKQFGGNIQAILCTHDGYYSQVGEILNEYYTSNQIVEKLILLGDISALYPRLEPNEGESHSFDHPAPNVTVAYARDRGEDLQIRNFSDLESFKEEGRVYGAYCYFWNGSEWEYFSRGDG